MFFRYWTCTGETAAQGAVAHIERLGGRPGSRHQRRRPVGDVRNGAHEVADVERPRLPRNVGGRKMVVEKGTLACRCVLGEDDAGIVLQELVDHHAVVADQAAELDRRDGAELPEVGRPLEGGGRRLQLRQERGAGGGGSGRLELDDHGVSGAMEGAVEALGPAGAPRPAAACPARRLPRPRRSRRPAAPRRGRADPIRAAEAAFDVAGALPHRRGGGVEHQHQPMRLDRSGDVDRLPRSQAARSRSSLTPGFRTGRRSAWSKPRTAPKTASPTRSASPSVSRSSTDRKLRQRAPVAAP